MKTTLFLIVALSFSALATAQRPVIWKGGAPGKVSDWNCPVNWSANRVPNEFDCVRIPDGSAFYPTLSQGEIQVEALLIEGSAALDVAPGASLTVSGESGWYDGMTIVGNIRNNGSIVLENMPEQVLLTTLDRCKGNGKIYFQGTEITLMVRDHD